VPDTNIHQSPRQTEEMAKALKGANGSGMFSRSPKQLETMAKSDGKNMGAQFYLIRHGATPLNSQDGGVDRIRGWSNVPLSPKGHKEAEALGNRLKDSGIKLLFHSTLGRAADTAKAIAEKTNAKLIPSDNLLPWNVGVYTGRNSNEAHPELVKLAEKQPDMAPENGESFNDFKERALHGLREAIHAANGQPMGIVTHHRVERLINGWLANGQQPDFSIDFDTMFRHGEDPATAQKVNVSLNALNNARVMRDAVS
jgi:broad specificity phosphatase PhoE